MRPGFSRLILGYGFVVGEYRYRCSAMSRRMAIHAALLEAANDVLVVDNGMPHIHRRAVDLEGKIDHLDRIGDARAESPRGGEDDLVHTKSLPVTASSS